jgi:hypothetical protein
MTKIQFQQATKVALFYSMAVLTAVACGPAFKVKNSNLPISNLTPTSAGGPGITVNSVSRNADAGTNQFVFLVNFTDGTNTLTLSSVQSSGAGKADVVPTDNFAPFHYEIQTICIDDACTQLGLIVGASDTRNSTPASIQNTYIYGGAATGNLQVLNKWLNTTYSSIDDAMKNLIAGPPAPVVPVTTTVQ